MLIQFITFLVRWFANSLGLWLAAQVFNLDTSNDKFYVIIISGLILAVLNALIKPLLVIFTLPAVALSLGLFMIVINGFIVFLMDLIYSPSQVGSFWNAILVGMVIGLVNYIITFVIGHTRKDYA